MLDGSTSDHPHTPMMGKLPGVKTWTHLSQLKRVPGPDLGLSALPTSQATQQVLKFQMFAIQTRERTLTSQINVSNRVAWFSGLFHWALTIPVFSQRDFKRKFAICKAELWLGELFMSPEDHTLCQQTSVPTLSRWLFLNTSPNPNIPDTFHSCLQTAPPPLAAGKLTAYLPAVVFKLHKLCLDSGKVIFKASYYCCGNGLLPPGPNSCCNSHSFADLPTPHPPVHSRTGLRNRKVSGPTSEATGQCDHRAPSE
ncbi:hypothetical protein STEG23_000309 [Scotinomys teguina]